MIERVVSRLLVSAIAAPIVLDAAMGTRLIARGLSLQDDDPALWNLTHPDEVSRIHALDVAAGAHALLTNTFGANRVWLARYGKEGQTAFINTHAAKLAREAAGPHRLVIGSIGPTASADPAACREQARALAESGVDAILFETHSADQAALALKAVGTNFARPLLVSLISWPEPVADTVHRLEDLGANALGSNCEHGMKSALATARTLAPLTKLPLLVKPAVSWLGASSESPESFAAAIPSLLDCRVRFLGGCCGTTEAHVDAISAGCYAASTFVDLLRTRFAPPWGPFS